MPTMHRPKIPVAPSFKFPTPTKKEAAEVDHNPFGNWENVENEWQSPEKQAAAEETKHSIDYGDDWDGIRREV